MAKGDRAAMAMDLPAVSTPGEYWLKLDMVSEGADWFENGGSPVAWVPFSIHE